VSWKLALALNIFILLITLALLFFLGCYIRKNYLRRKRLGFEMEDGERNGRIGGNVRFKLRRSPRKWRGRVGIWEAELGPGGRDRERWIERGRSLQGDGERGRKDGWVVGR